MIRIKFFAMFRDEVGRPEVETELKGERTLQELLERLKDEVPGLEKILREETAIMALNQEVVDPETPIKDGDEVALFPPVSGG